MSLIITLCFTCLVSVLVRVSSLFSAGVRYFVNFEKLCEHPKSRLVPRWSPLDGLLTQFSIEAISLKLS